MADATKLQYEVIIIGGSYAGLSAAMTLGRALRNVLVIDGGNPCNRFAPQAHNLPGFDGEAPQFISDKIREQVRCYSTVDFLNDWAVRVKRKDNGFEVFVSDDTIYNCKKLLLSTGVTDILPDVSGFTECWGKTAVHCPYCHGYEIANKKIGVLAHGDAGVQMAQLIRQWSAAIHILTNGNEDFSKHQLQELHDKGTRVITKEVKEMVHTDGVLSKVIFIDGTEEALDAVYARVGVKQSTDIPKAMGCEFDSHDFIIVDEHNRTKVPGLFAAGDNMSSMRSLAVAMASGTKAAIFINKELVDETM